MANTNDELTVSSQLPGTEGETSTVVNPIDNQGEVREEKVSEDDSKTVVANDVEKTASTISNNSKASTISVRPSLVQLGSGLPHHMSSNQPKRFSAVNINKKFLEKNSSASASSLTSQPAIKVGGPSLARPQTQPTVIHSRLVTAKLTSTSPASSTSGAGWSRSSSVAPHNATGTQSPNNSSPPLPTTNLGASTSTMGASPLSHSSKVIQPQPRAASVLPGISQRDSLGLTKPVWGNVKSATVAQRLDVRNDFPTAAEIAQGTSSLRTTKPNDTREIAENAAMKPARMEEADAFRGVHLDPNAHHWDEMEEDDDNFLDSVIEFGDGRQYKIEANNAASSLTKTTDPNSPIDAVGIGISRLENTSPLNDAAPNLPVKKEERFADDFDRSWPRTSPASSRDIPSSRSGTSYLPPSPVRPPESSAQQESARVLFNERSNRLEPYSNGQRSGQYASRKGGLNDSLLAANEPRNARELLQTSQSSNVQLLQKPGDTQTRHRGFSNASTGGDFGPGSSNTYNRDRDIARRDGLTITPRLSKDSFGPPGRDRESHNERERRSEMAPPPLPTHALRHLSRDDGRQLPPHLPQASANPPVRQEGRLARGSRFPPQGETSAQSTRLPSQSPTLSHASTTRMSPIVSLNSLPQLSAHDIDEVRKDVMQSAAARAKQRRQQEEEEREKEKERARRKAAELEERIKAAEAEKTAVHEKLEEINVTPQQQEEAIALIEEAVKGVQPLLEKADSPTPKSTIPRLPSPRALRSPESAGAKLKSDAEADPTSRHRTSTISVAVQAESWRTKATPRLPLSAPLQSKPSAPSFISPIQVESLVDTTEDDLEVVDFMDMGKFVGVSNAIASISTTAPQPPRPVASDFFDENSRTEPSAPLSPPSVPKVTRLSDLRLEASVRDQPISDSSHLSDLIPVATVKASPSTDQPATILPPQTSMRTARNQPFYKEATMSALDDAMSRIKGALDGMQAGEGMRDAAPSTQQDVNKSQVTFAARPNMQKERWIPPALRRHLDPEREVLLSLSTSSEPPPSPKPARNAFTIKLPSVSPSSLEPISKKQLQAAMKPPFPLRMDIFSFNPPVQGMNKRDLSINDILFHKPIGRAKLKYRVNLPRMRPVPKAGIAPQHLPFKAVGVGAFGRPSEADGLSSWRKPVQTKQEEDINTKIGPTASPAANASSIVVASVPVPEPSASTKLQGAIPVRPRVPKMPAGSSVAIYRDSRIDAVDADTHTSVNFIVGSELESQQDSQATTPNEQLNVLVTPPIPSASISESMYNVNKPHINGIKETVELASSLVSSNESDGQGSVDSVDPVPVTPQITHHTTSPWARTSLPMPVKDSPARGPDPEHLRAVWSQTSNKAGTHGVNSLEGIVDDLTALPFTLQDVKSEDGETPPPSISAPPSRMSIHDVTKAFQQVPQSPSNPSSSRRTPPLTAPPARPPNYGYGLLPPPSSNIRPGYAYPPPIMSPSPSLMYPSMMPASPVPGRMPMNGHTPLYGQPMWMPMPAGSAPQAHTNMMRHMTSPYPTHMVPYSPGPPMYAPQPPTVQNQVQQSGPQVNRDRSIPLMSPVIPPAGPLMYGSPVMMPAHATVAPTHGYLVPPGRSQTRVDNNSQIPQTPQQPPHYNPSTFRPTW